MLSDEDPFQTPHAWAASIGVHIPIQRFSSKLSPSHVVIALAHSEVCEDSSIAKFHQL